MFMTRTAISSVADPSKPEDRQQELSVQLLWGTGTNTNSFPLFFQQSVSAASSQNQNYFTTGSLSPICSSWWQAPWDSRPVIFSNITASYVTSSLIRGCVCRLQLLLVLASIVNLRSESRGTHDHNLPSQIRDSPDLEGQLPVFISLRNSVARLYPQARFPFRRLLRLAGLRWRYSTPPLHRLARSQSQSQSYIATDGRSISKSWCRAPSGAHDQIFIIVTVLFLWGALSDERTSLSFIYADGPRQVDFLGSESLGTRGHILLSQIWDFPFRRLLRRAGSRWRYSTPEIGLHISTTSSYLTGNTLHLHNNNQPVNSA
jgi:hypothetical protein